MDSTHILEIISSIGAIFSGIGVGIHAFVAYMNKIKNTNKQKIKKDKKIIKHQLKIDKLKEKEKA